MVSIDQNPLLQSQSRTYTPYGVSVNEYTAFREHGFLIVRGLISHDDVQELNDHMNDVLAGCESFPGVQPAPSHLSANEIASYWERVHMLHRVSPIHERYLLHPRILGVLEAIIGPDVLALQSMLFFKQPGQPGQGYHQDSYYIPTLPDTLCGAWLALEPATEENGCMWMVAGSQCEPIYPDLDGVTENGDWGLRDIEPIAAASHPDESVNRLARVARKYAGQEVKVEAQPGDMVFFNGHILHRSHANRSKTQSRHTFVGHYCNARSLVPWNYKDNSYEGESANYLHILARGSTHLPHAQPRFGTPCAANRPDLYSNRPSRTQPASLMPTDRGIRVLAPELEEETIIVERG